MEISNSCHYQSQPLQSDQSVYYSSLMQCCDYSFTEKYWQHYYNVSLYNLVVIFIFILNIIGFILIYFYNFFLQQCQLARSYNHYINATSQLDLSDITVPTLSYTGVPLSSTPISKNYIEPLQNMSSPIVCPTSSKTFSPQYSTTDSGFVSNITSQSISTDLEQTDKPALVRRRIRRRAVKLAEVAVRILTSWYPSHDTTQILATSGNITVEQVQNRRMRDRNTKPLRVIAARRKRLIIDDSFCLMPNVCVVKYYI